MSNLQTDDAGRLRPEPTDEQIETMDVACSKAISGALDAEFHFENWQEFVNGVRAVYESASGGEPDGKALAFWAYVASVPPDFINAVLAALDAAGAKLTALSVLAALARAGRQSIGESDIPGRIVN
jgi:hypothetical protein